MQAFFDTSVLVAAFWHGHVFHEPSIRLFAATSKKQAACGIHSVAEVYATMTVLPVKPMIPPEHAMLFVEEIRNRLTLVSLNEGEYFETLHATAAGRFTSGRVYDALLLRCAAKIKAQPI